MNFDFSFDTQHGKFSDSLWIPDGQPVPSEAELDAMKQQRLAAWLDFLANPPQELQE
jgi:hypothetical protein